MPLAGSDFARSQLEKYGWREGQGLGREEGGITEALKPKLKFNSTGLGYDLGEQFKFQWWDHVFNKAADNITVKKDQDGSVVVKHTENLEVSTKRPSANNTKDKFYGGFVKVGTLVGATETPASDSSDEEEEQEKDRSLRLSDEQLFKLCKGRTAHKGARHGLNMTAKLARVREQELALLQEWGAADAQVQQDQEAVQPKKKKKKSSKNKDVQDVTCADGSEPENCVQHKKKKKSKRKKDEEKDECVSVENKQEAYESIPVKKKKKKHNTEVTDPCVTEVCVTTTKQKKKKKKKKECNE